jgi:hypothetical protein
MRGPYRRSSGVCIRWEARVGTSRFRELMLDMLQSALEHLPAGETVRALLVQLDDRHGTGEEFVQKAATVLRSHLHASPGDIDLGDLNAEVQLNQIKDVRNLASRSRG